MSNLNKELSKRISTLNKESEDLIRYLLSELSKVSTLEEEKLVKMRFEKLVNEYLKEGNLN